MNTTDTKTASVQIRINANMYESERIPKLIKLFDQSLKPVFDKWYESNDFIIDALNPGTYTLRLSMSSGIQKDETFDLEEGESKVILFDIGNNSPHESHEWAYFKKNFSIQSSMDVNMKTLGYYREEGKMVSGKIWKYNNGSWLPELFPEFMNQIVRNDGNTFSFQTMQGLSLLEISGEGMPNLYVSLPPDNRLNCLVKVAESDDEEIHPIDVTVSTDHQKAETLLTLLTNGELREAKLLSNAHEAEKLLLQKMVNPVTAAIGGYFLLKINELGRLHNWANNLANWFPWLPDGLIIHATQLLSKNDKTQVDLDLIRSRLLQAAWNGLPVYTEGLRLLLKGLTQLWYYSEQKDNEIKNAYDRISDYVEASDFSQETTTFIGISPSQPGRVQQSKTIVKNSALTIY